MHSLRLPLIALATVLALLLWCFSLTGTAPADLVIGNGPDPRSLDPAQAQSVADARVLASLFEGLVIPDPLSGTPAAAMAQHWTESQDGLRWSFTLRPGLKWSDGRAIDAPDIAWSMLRFLKPATGARMADLLDAVIGAEDCRRGRGPASAVAIEAPDASTLIFRLRERHPCFLKLLAQFPLYPVPRHVYEKHGAAWTSAQHFVSNGPFRLVHWRLRDRIRVERNPHWRDAAQLPLGSIDWRCIDSPATLLNLYVAGALDIAMDVPLSAIPALLASPGSAPGSDLRRHPRLGTFFLRMNVAQPGFAHSAVRRALSLVVDRDLLCSQLLRGGEEPAWSFTPTGMHCGALPYSALRASPLSLDEARAELRIGLQAQGMSTLPAFELLHTTDPLDSSVAEWLQHRYTILGVTCKTVALDAQSLRTRMADGDYAMARSSWMADYDDASNYLECFESSSGANRTGWSHAPYDALLREARSLAGADAERAAKLRAAEALLLHEGPIVPLFHYCSRSLVQPYVRGFEPNPLEWLNPAALRVQR
ncbi:MAG: peptide ABC transporter substrate-binding protein [Planctomycetes bacterium]|nr:peptide ABC transporter substrate-binding protein [Planctomycetota bacterium]